MKPHESQFGRRRLTAHLIAAASLLAAALLFRYPPDQYALYPACPIFRYTHLLCPGCGATRALACLVRGHLSEAFHQNALFILLLPAALFYAVRSYCRALAPGSFQWLPIPAPALAATLAATVIFTVARNI